MITLSTLSALATVGHGFFTREGGVSDGLYSSRNCGFGSGDDPARVRANRALCMRDLGLGPEALVTARQGHTATALEVAGPFAPEALPTADAMATTVPGLALGVLSADCAPVLLADPHAGVIGAAHAGWKGALNGVLDATVEKMAALGARPARMIAGVGPCIARRSYEVGPDFSVPFLSQDRDNERFFAPSGGAGKVVFDLPGYVVHKLARLGVGEATASRCDTCRQDDRFFSYRRSVLRGESDYGRMLSAIVLER